MLLQAFIHHLRYERNAAERTQHEYESDLKAFEAYFRALDDGLAWTNVDADVARDWMASMIERGLKPSTVQRRAAALRTFYRYLLEHGHIAVDPMHTLKTPRRERPLPVFVRDDEMNRLLDQQGMFADTFEGRRDRLIVAVFYHTGLRRSELVQLDIDDVDLGRRQLVVRHAKGGKQRIVPFGEELAKMLESYIAERVPRTQARDDGHALFVDSRGRRMTPAKVYAMVRHQLGMVTTLRKRSPHVLRHTFATSMLNHRANLQAVKELLGHSRLATTEIYTHISFEDLKREYANAHPRA